jgi:nucleoside-diphosphate-sugar epimerase
VARVLIVGCGCRGRELAAALAEAGHAVRGTSRDPARLAGIETAGAEAVQADPDRLGTVAAQLEGVSVLCWLMGTATGAADRVAAIHGPRLESMLGAIVDTPVRGVVYEAAGTVDPGLLGRGRAAVEAAGRAHRMPVEIVDAHPRDPRRWLPEATAAVARTLSA